MKIISNGRRDLSRRHEFRSQRLMAQGNMPNILDCEFEIQRGFKNLETRVTHSPALSIILGAPVFAYRFFGLKQISQNLQYYYMEGI